MKVELKSKSLGEVKSSLVDRIDDFGFNGEGLAFKGKEKVKALSFCQIFLNNYNNCKR